MAGMCFFFALFLPPVCQLTVIPFGLTVTFFHFLCSRRVVIVVDMDILQSAEEAGGKIGNPTPYNTGVFVVCFFLRCAFIK